MIIITTSKNLLEVPAQQTEFRRNKEMGINRSSTSGGDDSPMVNVHVIRGMTLDNIMKLIRYEYLQERCGPREFHGHQHDSSTSAQLPSVLGKRKKMENNDSSSRHSNFETKRQQLSHDISSEGIIIVNYYYKIPWYTLKTSQDIKLNRLLYTELSN